MTAVTTTASGIAFGAYDVAIAGGVEHMGHHPMGQGIDPNPRIVAEKLVDQSALIMGQQQRIFMIVFRRSPRTVLTPLRRSASSASRARMTPE
jgi:acetyl-CoA acetyltransferase